MTGNDERSGVGVSDGRLDQLSSEKPLEAEPEPADTELERAGTGVVELERPPGSAASLSARMLSLLRSSDLQDPLDTIGPRPPDPRQRDLWEPDQDGPLFRREPPPGSPAARVAQARTREAPSR